MKNFLIRRVLMALMVLLTISFISFVMLKVSGDLAISLAGENAGADYVDFLRKTYGWDRPLYIQYGDWLWNALHGNLGASFYYGKQVMALVAERMPVTLKLGALATGLAIAAAIPMGMAAGIRPGSLVDRIVLFIALLGGATPIFWTSFLLILVLGLNLRWLPITGGTDMQHLIMPALALSFYSMPAIIRIVRSGMVDVMASDYIRTARAKGLRGPAIYFRHALRNTLVPVVAVASVQFGFLLGGSVVVENIFAINGIGYLTWEAINQNDYPVVQASVLTVSAAYVVLTLFADLVNRAIDPRIRLE
ncbi:ABC transporter permease subunit [Sinorhizobium medicae]|uniref:ABC transporter permease n=1 Tax=Sinorhizobium medicae TaxID=110321 RepID=A0A508X838_9HYPH|nr:ABC transporter permease [Sinorhizobium medicae]MDX0438763.1 ABC transporter permease subunit [Sinorhizobium medicae]MDX0457175.1 ABC transporter permease subunit [Sinorhizobium medicae]MDX0500283.1 ABC transporter permease subunit [Sinorhizobium medicae]MDX0506034.1 ABC transporter permease subunit [Sinorhizobium medicae]MDX0523552.1 ABC transporter permease subunit [Sinorhizobium medicae]